MLSPKYLEALPQPIIKIYSEFENELLGDIAKRITKADYLTPTAEWRLYKAEQLRLSSREITQRLAKLTGRSEKEIRQLYTGALKEALRNDEKIYRAAIKSGYLSEDAEHKLDSYFGSIAFSNALKAGYRNTNGLMRNLCNSAAAQANSRLSDELDKAFLKVASGAYTADEAVYSAVQDLGKSGIKVINYSSGHKDKVDVAVRRAVITGIGQAAGNMQLSLAADMGCDLVEVTAHLGARPSHAVWQGHIYSLSGKDPKYPDFRSSTGYGTGAGLCGWNCRHSFYPYFEGLSKPNGVPFTREENDEVYRNTQKQRAYERAVRQSKRELAALDGARSATDDETLKQKLDRDFRRKAVTLKRREAKLEEHLRNTGLLPDNSRVRVDGFGRSVSQKAVHASNKSYLQYMNKLGIENPPKTIALFNQMRYNDTPEYKLLKAYMNSVENGMLSPLVGFEKYQEYYNRVQTEIIGLTTVNGVEIKSQSKHFLERVFGTGNDPSHDGVSRSGVGLEEIIDALKNGTVKQNPKDATSVSFVTDKCSVSVNPITGNLIQVNPK